MTSNDKDFRFMATNDLMSELQKDSIKLDDDSERKIVRMLLKLLEDKNGEVQNLAVRWRVSICCVVVVKCFGLIHVLTNIFSISAFFSLGPLVCKVKDHQVEAVVDTLCNNMVNACLPPPT